MSSPLIRSPRATPFHPKRRSACDRCHKQKLKCAKLTGQPRCVPCTRSKRPCKFSPALGASSSDVSAIGQSKCADLSNAASDMDVNFASYPFSGGSGEVLNVASALNSGTYPHGSSSFGPGAHVVAATGPQAPSLISKHTTQDGYSSEVATHLAPDSIESTIDNESILSLLGLSQPVTSETTDTATHQVPETLVELVSQLSSYRQTIPRPMIHWAPIETCFQHGGTFSLDSDSSTAEEKACLDCINDQFETYRMFDLTEHLIRLHSRFIEQVPTEEVDLGELFLLISCHHKMISLWEIIAYHLCYVVHMKAKGKLPPSQNKTCAFLKMGFYFPSPVSVLLMYCTFFKDIAGKLTECVDKLHEKFDPARLAEGESFLKTQINGAHSTIGALVERAKVYEAVVSNAEEKSR